MSTFFLLVLYIISKYKGTSFTGSDMILWFKMKWYALDHGLLPPFSISVLILKVAFWKSIFVSSVGCFSLFYVLCETHCIYIGHILLIIYLDKDAPTSWKVFTVVKGLVFTKIFLSFTSVFFVVVLVFLSLPMHTFYSCCCKAESGGWCNGGKKLGPSFETTWKSLDMCAGWILRVSEWLKGPA